MKKLPKASYQNSIYSGAILGVFFGFGEGIGGNIRIILGSIATLWFLLSAVFCVGGFENLGEVDPRKASYWKAHTPRLKRALIFMVSFISIYGLIFNIIKEIKT